MLAFSLWPSMTLPSSYLVVRLFLLNDQHVLYWHLQSWSSFSFTLSYYKFVGPTQAMVIIWLMLKYIWFNKLMTMKGMGKFSAPILEIFQALGEHVLWFTILYSLTIFISKYTCVLKPYRFRAQVERYLISKQGVLCLSLLSFEKLLSSINVAFGCCMAFMR